jgi:hypothetical protein
MITISQIDVKVNTYLESMGLLPGQQTHTFGFTGVFKTAKNGGG